MRWHRVSFHSLTVVGKLFVSCCFLRCLFLDLCILSRPKEADRLVCSMPRVVFANHLRLGRLGHRHARSGGGTCRTMGPSTRLVLHGFHGQVSIGRTHRQGLRGCRFFLWFQASCWVVPTRHFGCLCSCELRAPSSQKGSQNSSINLGWGLSHSLVCSTKLVPPARGNHPSIKLRPLVQPRSDLCWISSVSTCSSSGPQTHSPEFLDFEPFARKLF